MFLVILMILWLLGCFLVAVTVWVIGSISNIVLMVLAGITVFFSLIIFIVSTAVLAVFCKKGMFSKDEFYRLKEYETGKAKYVVRRILQVLLWIVSPASFVVTAACIFFLVTNPIGKALDNMIGTGTDSSAVSYVDAETR